MPLHRIQDFDPDYRIHQDQDVMDFDLYSGTDKIGSIDDLLVDDTGKIRYLVINTGLWILGKKVLLPIGQARIDFSGRRATVNGLTREQVEALPAYDGNMPVDYEHEEQVRGVYRPMAAGSMATGAAMGSASIDAPVALDYNRDTYAYDRDPGLYDLDADNHQNLRLYEERLIANKTRMKTGEVSIGKHVETETARVAVPIEKERVVIERVAASGDAVMPDGTAFQSGEVTRMEVYEETPEIHKEAFVREEVRVRKEVERETVTTEETLRREELDVNTQGQPVVDGDLSKDRL